MHSPNYLCSALLTFISIAAAASLNGRAQCFPNFEDASLSVTNGALQWGFGQNLVAGSFVVPTSEAPDIDGFFIQQNDDVVPGYAFNLSYLLQGKNREVAVSTSSPTFQLTVENVINTSSQLFGISCTACATDIGSTPPGVSVATGCTITSVLSTSPTCLEVESTEPLFFTTCTGANSQVFSFVTK
ncbi:hypothetical protein C8J56DRAFT_925845 [Mycena floridula]|nr:hypothetical protein C8J56DRAFT_925845 [Mycena floridula]